VTFNASQDQPADGRIDVRRDGPAAVLTLARPERSNAYTQAMLEALDQEIARADADAAVRVIVVTGTGDRAFSGGADRAELAVRDWRAVLELKSARVFERLRRSRCVTIAAINGAAVGGGLELAISCDLRVAVTGSTFRLPEPEFGLLPAAGGTALLPLLVGPLKTKELILGGASWDAAEALAHGLLTEVVAPGDLWARVTVWIDRIVRRDPDALRLAKQAIDAAATGTGASGFALVAQSLLVSHSRNGND
jgi:enoyl-CoA hydratase/carnithine racemase